MGNSHLHPELSTAIFLSQIRPNNLNQYCSMCNILVAPHANFKSLINSHYFTTLITYLLQFSLIISRFTDVNLCQTSSSRKLNIGLRGSQVGSWREDLQKRGLAKLFTDQTSEKQARAGDRKGNKISWETAACPSEISKQQEFTDISRVQQPTCFC